jgi:phage tail-like protein
MSAAEILSHLGAKFSISIDNDHSPAIISVSGIERKVGVVDIKKVNARGQYVPHRQGGLPESGEVTITRPKDFDPSWANWMNKCADSNLPDDKRSMTVKIHDPAGGKDVEIVYFGCIVKSHGLSELKAGSNDPITEKIVVAYTSQDWK